MVDDQTLNRIMARLVAAKRRDDWFYYLLKEAGHALNTPEEVKFFAYRLFVLNKWGVENRYGKGSASEFRPMDYEYQAIASPSDIQAHKSLGCLLYQCSEGNVPDHPLFKLLTEIKHALAEEIVQNLPEYDQAAWG
jgi:hypothetical protein